MRVDIWSFLTVKWCLFFPTFIKVHPMIKLSVFLKTKQKVQIHIIILFILSMNSSDRCDVFWQWYKKILFFPKCATRGRHKQSVDK